MITFVEARNDIIEAFAGFGYPTIATLGFRGGKNAMIESLATIHMDAVNSGADRTKSARQLCHAELERIGAPII